MSCINHAWKLDAQAEMNFIKGSQCPFYSLVFGKLFVLLFKMPDKEAAAKQQKYRTDRENKSVIDKCLVVLPNVAAATVAQRM